MNRNEIKKQLPTGYRKVLANKTGYSTGYIDSWFRNQTENITIEIEAKNYLADILEKKINVEKRLSQLQRSI